MERTRSCMCIKGTTKEQNGIADYVEGMNYEYFEGLIQVGSQEDGLICAMGYEVYFDKSQEKYLSILGDTAFSKYFVVAEVE